MKRVGYQEELDNEEELIEFLKSYKENKEKMLENGPVDETAKPQSNAFEGAAKTVVAAVEREAPGTVSKDVKDKMQIYKKDNPDENLNDRVVATINTDNKLLVSGFISETNTSNPLNDLHNKFKDNYGKILANQAVNFYANVVQPKMNQPAPPVYPPQSYPGYPPAPYGYHHQAVPQAPPAGYPVYPPMGYSHVYGQPYPYPYGMPPQPYRYPYGAPNVPPPAANAAPPPPPQQQAPQ